MFGEGLRRHMVSLENIQIFDAKCHTFMQKNAMMWTVEGILNLIRSV